MPYLRGVAELEFQLQTAALEKSIEDAERQNAPLHATSRHALALLDSNHATATAAGACDNEDGDLAAHLGAQSALPEHLQHELLLASLERVKTGASACAVLQTTLRWLMPRWSAWSVAYSEKRAQLYEYHRTARTRRNANDENDNDEEARKRMEEAGEMPDMEMEEVGERREVGSKRVQS